MNGKDNANKINLINIFNWIDYGSINWSYPFIYIRRKSEPVTSQFPNKSRKKLGTLTDSVHARIVQAIGSDCLVAILVLNRPFSIVHLYGHQKHCFAL
jgi:hypothetical protein